MRTPIVMLAAVTRTNRHAVMTGVNDAVLACGGWIEGHTLFSNTATVFRLVLPAERTQRFAGALTELAVKLDQESKGALANLKPGKRGAEADQALSLSITFIHNEPELRREIPKVPG